MSRTVDIFELDEDDYKNLIGEDIAENMDREYYNGILSCDDSEELPGGGIIWQICNAESDEDTSSEIAFFNAPDLESAQNLLKEYTERIADEEVRASYFELQELKDELKEILTENGFSISEKESRDLKVTVNDALGCKIPQMKKFPQTIMPLREVQLIQFRQGITNCLFSGMNGLYDDLALLPKEWYEQDISCYAIQDNKFAGIFLVHLYPSGLLAPVLLFGVGVEARMTILQMLAFFIGAASKKYSPDTGIVIRCKSERTEKLVKYLFPKKKGERVFAGERPES